MVVTVPYFMARSVF